MIVNFLFSLGLTYLFFSFGAWDFLWVSKLGQLGIEIRTIIGALFVIISLLVASALLVFEDL